MHCGGACVWWKVQRSQDVRTGEEEVETWDKNASQVTSMKFFEGLKPLINLRKLVTIGLS